MTRRGGRATRWPKDPAKRALAAYAVGDLELTAAALDEAWTPSSADLRDPVRGDGDFTVLSHYLTWLHAEVPAWIGKASTLTAQARAEAAERCADVVASGADSMFGPDRKPSRSRKAVTWPVEPQPSEIRTAVAEGVGILAHREGGVAFSGQHWCTAHHAGCPGTWDIRVKDLHRVEITGAGRAMQGAHFTPRWLSEEVTDGTLEALVWNPGPLDTTYVDHWRLKSSAEILALTSCDISVGAGAFLLAGARYLADKALAAWSSERDPRSGDRAEALRLVIGHCLYGVDINPWSTELAKLNLLLLVPHATVPELDRHIVVGDSLVGISDLEQVRWMHPRVDLGRELHTVPHPYTDITAEFVTVAGRAMQDPRPDLTYPQVWALLGILCDLAVMALLEQPVINLKQKIHMLQAARQAHDLLTADRSWREAAPTSSTPWTAASDPARRALSRRDDRATARLRQLHAQLTSGTPLAEIQVTR